MTKEELLKTDQYLSMSFDNFLQKSCSSNGELELLSIFYDKQEDFIYKLPLMAIIRIIQNEGGRISLTLGKETWEYNA